MKYLAAATILALLSLLSCTKSKPEESSVNDSALVVKPFRSPWVMPLTDYWKGAAKFVVVIPRAGSGSNLFTTDFSSGPDTKKSFTVLNDTLQGRILQQRRYGNACGLDTYYEVELGPQKLRGWILAGDVLTPEKFNEEPFAIGGKVMKLGFMKATQRRDGDNKCHTIAPLFFTDEKFLYLIDPNPGEELPDNLIYNNDNYLSLVDFKPAIAATIERGMVIMRWSLTNGTASISIGFADGHAKYNGYETDVPVQEGELQTVECTLQDVGLGDCYHVVFDCGDFGSARTELSDEEQAVWDELDTDKDGEVVVNPVYEGRTFIIIYKIVDGEPCGDPSSPGTKVELVTGFKLKE